MGMIPKIMKPKTIIEVNPERIKMETLLVENG
jgi:hypothetical protein